MRRVYPVDDATPIHLAALFGFTEVFEKLNNKSDTPLDGWTGMSLAAIGGHLNIVKFLVSITDTSIAPFNHICPPIHIAGAMGHLDIVKYFVASLPTPVLFPSGRTELTGIIQQARQWEHLEVVKFLEEHCQDTF